MQKLALVRFFSIVAFLFTRSGFCFEISFCNQTPFPELCNSIFDPDFEFHESAIKASINEAQEAVSHFLAMAQTTFDAQAKAAWRDCLELYEDTIRNLNLLVMPTSPTDVQKWLSVALINHQTCQNGLKDLNLSSHLKNLPFVLQKLSKMLVNLLAINKARTNKFSKTGDHRLAKLAEGGGEVTKANFVVAQDGSGDFETITKALKASGKQRIGTDRFVIYVKSGVYKENVIIEKSMTNLTLIGDGIDATVVTNDKNFNEGYLTYNTATVQVWGSGFVASGITFENTAGPEKQQAVALFSASDLSAFYKCSFKGYQDTLCLFQNRQFYRECDIYGTIDFIFGDATAVFQNCNIYVRKPSTGQENTITAQGRTDSNATTGFVIQNSIVTAAPDLAAVQGSVRTFLGRPWKEYSRVVYVKCYLDSLIDPEGWMPFQGNFGLDTLYYAESMNKGKGADTGGRVTWPGYHVLTSGEEVKQFTIESFLDGNSWIPRTGVPFNSGL